MTPEDKELDDNDLHVAVRLGDVDATKLALKQGYDPDTIGLFEWSPLHEACYNGDLEIVEILLEYDADPNKADCVSANTSLHYACSEGHAECLEALIKRGGKPHIQNSNGEDCSDQTSDPGCLQVLKNHGYGNLNQPQTKAEEKLKKSGKHEQIYTPKTSKSPKRPAPKESEQAKTNTKSTDLDESIDSGRASPTTNSYKSKRFAWDELKEERKMISSPVRSIGSSYGSLSSLGSSSCSAADDSAGDLTMSFRYNSKKQEFKVCVWEIRLISLIAASQMPKGTNIHLYIKSTIIPDDEFSSNPMMKRKSDTIHLFPGEHSDTSDNNQSLVSNWQEREAKLEFKNPITLEYKDVSKQLVHSSAVQVCLCVRPKRSLMWTSKHTAHDPVLASRELRLSDAVKRLMKESYEAERHDVLGLTRQSFPLEDIIAHKGITNHSFNSDPNVRIHMSSLLDVKQSENRCASDGDLQKSSVHKTAILPQSEVKSKDGESHGFDKAPTYSHTSLKGVSTHTTPINKQTKVPVFSISKSMETLDIKSHKTRDNNPKVKVKMPQFNSGYYSQVEGNLQTRGRTTNQHSRSRPHSGKKLLAAAANNIVHLDTSVVQAIDNEESSVGSPSEKKISDFEKPASDHIYTHQRANSSNSFTEVDESPSPSRRRKPYIYNSPKHSKQLTVPQVISKSRRTKKDLTVQIDPKYTTVNFEHQVKHRETIEMQTIHTSNKEPLDCEYKTHHDPRLKPRVKQLNNTKPLSSKEQALRRLIYDESDLDEFNPHSNPCFVHD